MNQVSLRNKPSFGAGHIYVSCPMSIPTENRNKILEYAKKHHHTVLAWERGTEYTQECVDAIKNCAGFVVILPNMAFKHYTHTLPAGTRKELMLALDLQKPIYIGYKSHEGYFVYAAEYQIDFEKGIGTIEGVAGSRMNFTEMCVLRLPANHDSVVANATRNIRKGILLSYRYGMSVKQIASEQRITPNQVIDFLKDMGVDVVKDVIDKHTVSVTDVTDKRIIALL